MFLLHTQSSCVKLGVLWHLSGLRVETAPRVAVAGGAHGRVACVVTCYADVCGAGRARGYREGGPSPKRQMPKRVCRHIDERNKYNVLLL